MSISQTVGDWLGRTWERVERGGQYYAVSRSSTGQFARCVPWGDFIKLKQNQAAFKQKVKGFIAKHALKTAVSLALTAFGLPPVGDILPLAIEAATDAI